MTLEECYSRMNGNYGEMLERLPNPALIEKFMLKFLQDDTMSKLRDAVSSGNIEASFLAAHALKGVAANLSFTELSKAASDLTEQLRPRTERADETLFAKVDNAYSKIVEAIKDYQ